VAKPKKGGRYTPPKKKVKKVIPPDRLVPRGGISNLTIESGGNAAAAIGVFGGDLDVSNVEIRGHWTDAAILHKAGDLRTKDVTIDESPTRPESAL
jgi:hypothetical protein